MQLSAMLVERRDIHRKLERIVAGISADLAWRDDLLQEAEVHLWQIEQQDPGHTQSWYLQSCSFHLHKVIKVGKSVDSPKRSTQRSVFPDRAEGDDDCPHVVEPLCQKAFSDEMSAEDFILELLRRLTSVDCEILLLLTQGYGPSEIARFLHVSHSCVAKHRRIIMGEAVELGLRPAANPRACGTQSVSAEPEEKRRKAASQAETGVIGRDARCRVP